MSDTLILSNYKQLVHTVLSEIIPMGIIRDPIKLELYVQDKKITFNKIDDDTRDIWIDGERYGVIKHTFHKGTKKHYWSFERG